MNHAADEEDASSRRASKEFIVDIFMLLHIYFSTHLTIFHPSIVLFTFHTLYSFFYQLSAF